MTKTKSTKRALLMSGLALLMCVSMLIGSTFAWFTDSVTSGNNIIKSGNLDMEISYKPYGAENTDWTEVDEDTVIFGKDALYEPGYTEAVWLKVENVGSLAFKYDLALNVVGETEGINQAGDTFKLSDYLEVKYLTTTSTDMESGFYTTRESLDNFAFGSAANSGVTSLGDDIAVIKNGVAYAAGEDYSSSYVLVIISMPTYVGNVANHNGSKIPEINFTLTAMATQLTHESDSFGSDYDKDADYVAYYNKPGEYFLNANMKATKATDVITADGEGVVLNIMGGTYDAGDMECAVWAKNGAVVNIYGGTFTHNGDNTDATSAHHFDMIYAGANGGKINIYGGTFSAKSGGVWLLNEKDNQGVITVSGGSFLNWNPADNVSEGKNTNFVAPGFEVEAQTDDNGDVWYAVEVAAAKVSTFEDFKAAFTKGGRVELTNDIVIEEIIVMPEGNEVYLDMNGKKITPKDSSIDPMIDMKTGSSLVIDGNGTVDLGENKSLSFIYPRGDVTIKNGTFLRAAGDEKSEYGSFFVGINGGKGKLVIEDGYFDGGYYKENNCFDNCRTLLNCSWGQYIRVYGGTFVGQNPAWGDEGMADLCPHCISTYCQGIFLEGQTKASTELPEGYTITEGTTNDGRPTYTVTYSK